MKELKLELGMLLDNHEIVKCHDCKCKTCYRIKAIGKILYQENNTPYVMTNRDGRIKKCRTKLEIQKYLGVTNATLNKAMNSMEELKCWTIERVEK